MTDDLREALGKALGPGYTIDRELGGGGMSRVFVARDNSLDRDIVVKVLPPDLAGEISAERFRREIQVAAKLQHPHIVPVLSAGAAGALLYYTMPFIEGESLRGRLSRSGELRVPDVIRMARELADALAYAHESGVVHRDLKPENILLSRSHALVADFGVAKAVTDSAGAQPHSVLTSVGLALGTPAYMAPEQAAADPSVDHRADIYAMGCVLYEMLAGSPPFTGRPTQALLAAHMAEVPDHLGKRRPATPPALAALVMSMLEKRPADRPDNADAIIGVLDTLGASGSVSSESLQSTTALAGTSAADPVAPGSTGGWKGLGGWRMGVIGGALAGIALVAVVITTQGSRRQSTVQPGQNIAFAVTTANAAGSSSASAPIDAAIRDYLADAVTAFDNTRLVPAAGDARFVVSESVTSLGRDSVLVRVRLLESTTGKVLRAFTPVRASKTDPTSALERLRGNLRAAVGIIVHPMLGAAALPGTDSPNEQSFAEFSAALAGVDRLLSGSTAERQRVAGQLRRSYELDSGFIQPLAWLAFVGSTSPSSRKAADSMMAAVVSRHQGQLTSYERDVVEMLGSSLRGDNAASLRASGRLYRATPVEWTAQAYARALLQFASYRKAIAIYDSLSASASADDPQFWADYTRAHHQLGDHARELAVAREARKLMPERRGVRSFEISALIALDSSDLAMKAVDDALLLPVEMDVSSSPLVTLGNAAMEFRAHGNDRMADRVAGKAASLIPGLGDRELSRFLGSLSALGQDSVILRLAPSLLRQDSANFAVSTYYAIASIRRGDTATALRELQRIERVAGPLRPYTSGGEFHAAARITAALGRKEEALALASRAISQGQGFAMRRQIHSGSEFRSLRTTPEFRKLLAPRDD